MWGWLDGVPLSMLCFPITGEKLGVSNLERFEMAERDTYKYHLRYQGRVVHRGITNDLERRENEHQDKYPGSTIEQVGNRTTREAALEWEREGGKR